MSPEARHHRMDGLDLPPGPERRKAMAEAGWNISPLDFTDEELAAYDLPPTTAERRNPYDLPPGPERRAALAAGYEGVHPNIAPSDFSEAELAEQQATEDQLEDIPAGMKPISSLYDVEPDSRPKQAPED